MAVSRRITASVAGSIALDGLAYRRNEHRRILVRFEAGGDFVRGRVAWLLICHPDEAAPASDFEGLLGAVNQVGDIHVSDTRITAATR